MRFVDADGHECRVRSDVGRQRGEQYLQRPVHEADRPLSARRSSVDGQVGNGRAGVGGARRPALDPAPVDGEERRAVAKPAPAHCRGVRAIFGRDPRARIGGEQRRSCVARRRVADRGGGVQSPRRVFAVDCGRGVDLDVGAPLAPRPPGHLDRAARFAQREDLVQGEAVDAAVLPGHAAPAAARISSTNAAAGTTTTPRTTWSARNACCEGSSSLSNTTAPASVADATAWPSSG